MVFLMTVSVVFVVVMMVVMFVVFVVFYLVVFVLSGRFRPTVVMVVVWRRRSDNIHARWRRWRRHGG